MRNEPRVLIVDDEPKICKMLAAALGRQAYSIETCHDAAAALDRFKSDPFDVVISDLRMPGVNGFEFIQRIKDLSPATPVLAITGHATTETAVRAIQCGADDFIPKPFDIGQVRKLVEAAVRNRVAIEEAEAAAEAREPSPAEALVQANARLQDRVAELLCVHEATQTLIGDLRLDSLLESALATVASLTGARAVAIFLVERGREELALAARRGGRQATPGKNLANWVATHKVPLLIPSLKEQSDFQELARSDGYEDGSFLLVPLGAHGQTTGVVWAAERNGGQPFDERHLRMLVDLGPHLALAIENAAHVARVGESAFAALCTLAHSLEERDQYLSGHSSRVAEYAARLARELELSPGAIQTIRQAALIHDIGRLAVSDSILNRSGPLDPREREEVQKHPVIGERAIAAMPELEHTRPIVRGHHERWDGSGYPDQLRGREIDPLARILAIAEAYDAMTSPRPHRPAKSPREALEELTAAAGTQFDPDLVGPFCQAIGGMA